MEGDERPPVGGQRALGLDRAGGGGSQARLQRDRRRARQRGDLQEAQHLVLPEQVRHPAVEGRGVRGAQADGQPRAEPADEGVGEAPAAVELHRQVEALRRHRPEEAAQGRRVLNEVLGLADPAARRDGHHPVGDVSAVGQELGVPGPPEQDELRPGVRRAQRRQGGQGDDEVADAVGPQDGDLPDLGHVVARR